MRGILGVMALSLLGGCSSLSENDFECGVGKGMPCSSVYKVDHAVSRGELDFELEGDRPLTSVRSRGPLRPETPGPHRVWIAPYQDERGQVHGEKIVLVGD